MNISGTVFENSVEKWTGSPRTLCSRCNPVCVQRGMGCSSGDNKPMTPVTQIALSQDVPRKILLSEDVGAGGDFMVFNHFFMHGALSSSTL